jgi:hypothetical protein
MVSHTINPDHFIFKSGYAEHILKDTPVVTISGTRNMWMLSQEKLKVYLKDLKPSW